MRDVATALVAVHATDPATVHLSIAARAPTLGVNDTENELYDEHEVLRVLGMRRTLFVVPTDLVPAIHASCTRKIADVENRRLVKMLDEAGIGAGDPAGHLAALKAEVLDVLDRRGEALGRELAGEVDGLRQAIVIAEGKAYGGEMRLTTLVLSRMAMDGTIVRGRPTGSWLSGQYRYRPMRSAVDALDSISVDDGSAVLIDRYLHAFGPATFDDCRWWTGWTVTQTRRALRAVDAQEVDLDDGTGFVLPDDDGEDDPVGQPWAALLPALDATSMGWTDRDWYLGPHRAPLFDRMGNVGPTVWLDGRIVGGWAQQRSGDVVHRVLEDVTAEEMDAIDTEADRIGAWLDGTVVSPRFKTPLQRELSER